MVKTAARSQTTDEFARVLVQHHSVVHMKRAPSHREGEAQYATLRV